ncbi:hypothetical protein JOC24_002044 [Streptomyces sp. HB132]|nr:hypothetical protein [Streptomyces sp. HB132]
MEQVGIGVHPTWSEDRAEDGDERAVRVRKPGGLVHGGEAERKIARSASAQEDAHLRAGVLQPFDGGGQLSVESPQITRIGVRIRIVVHVRDPGEGEAQSGEALDPEEPDEVADAVLLVSVGAALRLIEQTDVVVMPYGPEADAGQLRHLPGAPRHDRNLPHRPVLPTRSRREPH